MTQHTHGIYSVPAPRLNRVYYCRSDPALFREWETSLGYFLDSVWMGLGEKYQKRVFRDRFGLDVDVINDPKNPLFIEESNTIDDKL